MTAVIDMVRTRLLSQDQLGVIAYSRVYGLTTDHTPILRLLESYRERHEGIDTGLDTRFSGLQRLSGPVHMSPRQRAAVDELFAAAGLAGRGLGAGAYGDEAFAEHRRALGERLEMDLRERRGRGVLDELGPFSRDSLTIRVPFSGTPRHVKAVVYDYHGDRLGTAEGRMRQAAAQRPAPSAQRPAPSARRPAPRASRPTPSSQPAGAPASRREGDEGGPMDFREWLAVTNGQALRFFFERLRDVSPPDGAPVSELLYNASVLAHFATTSTASTETFPPAPLSLTTVLDVFVLDRSHHADAEIMEAAASQCLLLTGFFGEQLRHRHNLKWYASVGAGFYEQAAQVGRDRDRARMMGAMAGRFGYWRRQQARLSRDLRESGQSLSSMIVRL